MYALVLTDWSIVFLHLFILILILVSFDPVRVWTKKQCVFHGFGRQGVQPSHSYKRYKQIRFISCSNVHHVWISSHSAWMSARVPPTKKMTNDLHCPKNISSFDPSGSVAASARSCWDRTIHPLTLHPACIGKKMIFWQGKGRNPRKTVGMIGMYRIWYINSVIN